MRTKNLKRNISLFLVLALVFWLAGAVSIYASNLESVSLNELGEDNEQEAEVTEDQEDDPINAGNPQKSCGDGYITVAKYEWVDGEYVAEFGEDIATITNGTSSGGYWTSSISIHKIRLYGGKDNKFIEYEEGAYEGIFTNNGMLDPEGETPDISNIVFCTIDTSDGEADIPEDNGEEPGDKEEPEDSYNFGERISEIAQGIQSGKSTVEELVKEATSIHLVVLANVHDKVPGAAKESIKKAMEKGPGDGPGTDDETEEENEEKNDEDNDTEVGVGKENNNANGAASKNIAVKVNNPSKNKGK